MFQVLLSVLVIESSSDESLGCVEGIFRICYSLYNILIKRNFQNNLTCLLAGIPTNLYPSSVKATTEGVVLIPIPIVNLLKS